MTDLTNLSDVELSELSDRLIRESAEAWAAAQEVARVRVSRDVEASMRVLMRALLIEDGDY